MKKAFLSISSIIVVAATLPCMAVSKPSPDATIYTYTVTTPNQAEIKMDEVLNYAGKTCGSMSLISAYGPWEAPAQTFRNNDSIEMSSFDIVYLFGPEYGCFKKDFIYNGKRYSTGDVKLRWDAKQKLYITADPNISSVNFR